MQKCLNCNAEVDDRAYVCPKCGSSTLMGSYSAEDALSMLDAVKGQGEAAQHVDRSAELYAQERLDEAVAELQAALKINPLNPTAHGNMGAVLLKQGKPKEAIPWLEKALELNPNLEGVSAALAGAKSAGSAQNSGCFIATACYGFADCPEVRTLRDFRDQVLLSSPFGRVLTRLYYLISPPVARWLKTRPKLSLLIRDHILAPIVKRICLGNKTRLSRSPEPVCSTNGRSRFRKDGELM